MKCYQCEKTLNDGPLFRVNEKGVDGIFGCIDHCATPVDPEVKELVDIIHNDSKENQCTK